MSHRIHSDLYNVDKSMADPGDGGTIRVTQDLQILELVSAAAETRTLAAPTKPGIRFVIRMLTDGGDIVVTPDNGFEGGANQATFADVGDMLTLISVATSSGFRWAIEDGNVGSVSISA